MIRWARRGERGSWPERWERLWPSADGRSRTVVTACSPDELLGRLHELTDARPGTRLVLTCRVDPMAGDGWPAGVGLNDWTPELPHRSDPWPGDPAITSDWMERERIDVDDAGVGGMGAVLSRRVLPDEFDGLALAPGTVARQHFPALAGGAMPMPAQLRGRHRFTAAEVAESFGLAASDTAPLIDELLASGALRTSDETTIRSCSGER